MAYYTVLFDGNGSGFIQVIGLGDYMPLKDHQAMVKECKNTRDALTDVMTERDALVAQVAELVHAIQATQISKPTWGAASAETIRAERMAWARLNDAITRSPAQALAEIKAQAGRAGWMACWNWVSSDSDMNVEQKTFEDFANEYAEEIRKGGAK